MQAQDILNFWFTELSDKQRFAKDAALDALMRERFEAALLAAAAGELYHWRTAPQGRLAEIVVLDQFSRNIWRDTPRAFAQDAQALVLAQELVAGGHDAALPPVQRAFAIHALALALFSQPGLEENLKFELRHQAIIARFGRYPHRNAVLGRASTPEELAFLREPGSSF
jgi:uncharacterized protein (DUF924 family)